MNNKSNPKSIKAMYAGALLIDVLIHYANDKLPFGGTNNSGTGKSHGFYGFQEFSHLRSIMKQNTYSPSSMFYPPYTAKVKNYLISSRNTYNYVNRKK